MHAIVYDVDAAKERRHALCSNSLEQGYGACRPGWTSGPAPWAAVRPAGGQSKSVASTTKHRNSQGTVCACAGMGNTTVREYTLACMCY